MNAVFGAGAWRDLRYETVDVAGLLSPDTPLIFMEGGDNNADQMADFIRANRAAIEAWGNAGGILIINAALPVVAGDAAPSTPPKPPAPFAARSAAARMLGMSLPFSVTLLQDMTGDALASNALHPIFNGPFLPVGTAFTSFGNGIVLGTGLTPLAASSDTGAVMLAERRVGAGLFIAGSMNAVETQGPQPEAANLRANLLAYGAAGVRRLQISGFPSPISAGAAGSFTVRVLDAYGQVSTAYTGTVAFSSSDAAATLPANYTFTAADLGVKTFSAALQTVGTQGLTVTDTAVPLHSGTQSGIVVVAAPSFASPPAATPNPATAGVAVQFSCPATGSSALTYIWDFGDGTMSTQPSPSHVYAAAGTYPVTVTVTDQTGGSATSTVTVQVQVGGGAVGPAEPGTADADGDGFINEIETALGSDPFDPAGTPFGLASPTAGLGFTVKALRIKLNFARPANHDGLRLDGVLPLAASFKPLHQRVILDVGGVVQSFELNEKGRSRNNAGVFYVRRKSTVGVTFTARLWMGTLAAALTDEGLVNADLQKAALTVPVTIVIGGVRYQANVPQSYSAKTGQWGRTK